MPAAPASGDLMICASTKSPTERNERKHLEPRQWTRKRPH
jgi:hypothetical protein